MHRPKEETHALAAFRAKVHNIAGVVFPPTTDCRSHNPIDLLPFIVAQYLDCLADMEKKPQNLEQHIFAFTVQETHSSINFFLDRESLIKKEKCQKRIFI